MLAHSLPMLYHQIAQDIKWLPGISYQTISRSLHESYSFSYSFDTFLSFRSNSKARKKEWVNEWELMMMKKKEKQQIVSIVGISFTKSQSCQFILLSFSWFSVTVNTSSSINLILNNLSYYLIIFIFFFHQASDLILFHLTESMNIERGKKKKLNT